MDNVNKQFIDDVDKIIEKYKDDAFVMKYLDNLVGKILKLAKLAHNLFYV